MLVSRNLTVLTWRLVAGGKLSAAWTTVTCFAKPL